MDGLSSCEQFYREHHISTIEAVINEQIEGAILFGVQCSQPYYFKFQDGYLYCTGMTVKTWWLPTKYRSILEARANSVIPIYNLSELILIYNREKGK